jgi:hypothetical protein
MGGNMNALTVVTKIKAGEKPALEKILTEISTCPGNNPYMRLPDGRNTHCLRCSIIHDEENGYRLLVAAEYDGDLESYLRELIQISPGMDAIWSKCEGYQGKEFFEQFIRKNGYETQAFYIAFRDETVESIKNKAAVRAHLERLLDDQYALAKPLLSVLSNLPPSTSLWKKLRMCLATWRKAFHDWWLSLALAIVKPLAVLGETKDFPLVTSVCSPQRNQNDLAPTIYDGQMITITEVRRSRRLRLRLGFMVNEFLGKYGYPPGLFAYVGTLFSFRWVLIDNRKRLIFISVFDGSWQNYMGDFIDKIIWALDGIYNNTEGYPPGGMTQVTEFQRWILEHQWEPQLFYKAYPKETVMKLIRDRDINNTASTILETRFDSAVFTHLTEQL